MAEVRGELPLSGVRVLDAANRLGAFGGRLLADFGADVVKIEPPGGGALRRVPPFAHGRMGRDHVGESLAFGYFEANKRGIVLDVGAESSREVLRGLAVGADVVLLSPSETEPVVGFGVVEDGVELAPASAIVVVVTPFGATGPLRNWRATHLISCALAGLLIQQGPVEGPPVVIPGEQMYPYVGINVAITVLAALRARDQEPAGIGQVADLSAHEILASTNFDFHTYADVSRIDDYGPVPTNASGGTWECADGEVMFLMASDKQWAGFLELIGRPAELADPVLSHPAVRASRRDEVMAIIRPLIKGMGHEEFVTRGQELGLPTGLVSSIEQFVDDAQPRSRGYFVPLDLGGETAEAPGAPFLSSGWLLEQYRRPAPRLGEFDPSDLIEEWRRDRPATPTGVPLSKIRVLSFGAALSGALTASVLADLGADVVKIESPVSPDGNRRLSSRADGPAIEPSGAQASAKYESFNRSVRSLAMDMRNPGAIELFLRLVRSADVVIDNFSPRVMRKWGLGHERLAAENPRLVQLSITGFGHTEGPRSHYVAYGGTVCAFVGLTRMWGVGHQVHFDYVAQSYAVLAVLAGLSARDRTNRGMFVDLAMIEAGGTLMGPMILDWTVNGQETVRPGNRVAGSVWSGVVRCDGPDGWIAVEAESPRDWRALVGVHHPESVDGTHGADPAFAAALENWLADKTPLRAARILQRAGVAAAPVQNAEDLYRDPQLRARHGILELRHPDLGPMEYVDSAYRLIPGITAVPVRAPRLGEHCDDILEGWLALGEREREDLRRNGAFGLPSTRRDRTYPERS